MYLGEERRQYARYNATGMTASISFQDETSSDVCVESVQPIDFNSFGMAIETNLVFEKENRISLDISCGRNHAPDILSIVRNVVNKGNKNRYGLQFDFAANAHMRSEEVEEILSSIEDTLKKNQNLPSRKAYRRNKAIDRRRRIKIIGR
ncbi:MAG TPA: PilZ domain-containing protein [Smithella sp.]|nr:PilZ domain-containing protein [Smithella sp.]